MSRPTLLRRSNNELKQMNDLNNRFMSFIQLVKSETVRSEELKYSLIEQKEKYFADFRQTNRNYLEKLNAVKKYLNELCMGVCQEQVREKRGRVMADWYAKLTRFEQSFTSGGTSSGVGSTVVLNSSGYFETSSPCSNSYLNSSDFGAVFPSALSEVTLIDHASSITGHVSISPTENLATITSTSQNLINLSGISSSQSSLNSCSSYNFSISASSSSSSSSASSAYTSEGARTSSTHTAYSCDHFSLEVYLSTLTKTRIQLNNDYEKKIVECAQLKQNIATLNIDLNGLNDNLDTLKIKNVKLNEDIKNMKREIEFLRRLYGKQPYSLSSEAVANPPDNDNLDNGGGSDSDKPWKASYEEWLRSEIELARAEVSRDFEEFTSEQLREYEAELESELMLEIERLDGEYSSREATLDQESEEILDELIELNSQLTEDFTEFESLSRINAHLNDRLIQLSTFLIEFNSMSKDKQERMIINYSIVSLKKETESRRLRVKELKQELNMIKSQLIQNDAFDLILKDNQTAGCCHSHFTLETASSNANEFPWMSLSHTRLDMTSTNKILILQQELLLKEFDEIKCAFHIRPYCAQIEYTKSHLFAYFLIKFDIIYHNYANASITNPNVNSNQISPSLSASAAKIAVTNNNSVNKNNCILNCLKIVSDSIDGHSILIENCHRILDIDLSEWTLKREIYQDAPIKSSRRSKPDYTIEYKFPKGFRLKRRKKINLIAAGKPKFDSLNTQAHFHSIPQSKKDVKLNQKLSMSCNSLNRVIESETSATRKVNTSISTSIKPACSSMSLNRLQSQLILASVNSEKQYQEKSKPKVKCSCCACKTLTTRKGDIEFFEVEEIANWGSGILVLTKLVNTKNVTKMVNYRYLKHIWVNHDHEKKNPI